MQRIFLNVGYELSEKQLRGYFGKFGVLSDLYLPKHANGRNKGYGFATFASLDSLALALQHPKHIVDGTVVQVKRAGARPSVFQDTKPAVEHVPFGQGPRIYVGGVHECLTETRLREHFARWGNILDIYFPGSRGPKRSKYCFVTFDTRRNAERACSESGRSLDGWPLESICMAGNRKVELDHSTLGHPAGSTAAGHPAAEAADKPSSLCYGCSCSTNGPPFTKPCERQLLMEPPTPPRNWVAASEVSPTSSGAHPAHPPLQVSSDLYSQSASLYNQIQEQASSLLPKWGLPPLSSAEPVGVCAPSQAPSQEALDRALYFLGTQGGSREDYAMLAQQSMMYAAEQERRRQQVAAQLQAIAAGAGFTQAKVGLEPRPHVLRDPPVGFGRVPAQFDGRSSLPYGFQEKSHNLSGAAQDFSAFPFLPQGY